MVEGLIPDHLTGTGEATDETTLVHLIDISDPVQEVQEDAHGVLSEDAHVHLFDEGLELHPDEVLLDGTLGVQEEVLVAIDLEVLLYVDTGGYQGLDQGLGLQERVGKEGVFPLVLQVQLKGEEG